MLAYGGRMNTRRSSRKLAKKSPPFLFHIYIAGQTPKSDRALARLKAICNEQCPGQYEIRVIDLASRPDLAKAHEVLAIPTVLRSLPAPVQRAIGDLTDKQKALLGLDLLKAAELDVKFKKQGGRSNREPLRDLA
jgi:circadian clock protein KaiB